jgi:hypothetical protein
MAPKSVDRNNIDTAFRAFGLEHEHTILLLRLGIV